MNRTPLERRNTVPFGVRALSPSDLKDYLAPENAVIIDVRTYTQYAEARVHGAVNVCIPSTLLKRESFNFDRMREFIPETSSQRLMAVDSCPVTILYDQETSRLEYCGSNSLLWTIRKIRQHLDSFNPDCKLCYISGGISALDEAVIDSKSLPQDQTPVNPLPPVVTQNINPPPSGATISITDSIWHHIDRFPRWIRDLCSATKQGRNPVAENWIKLQTAENTRVHQALSEHQFVAGDLSKNRYSNIAPYNHTRVLLKQSPDYINASHIQASYSPLRYIATQAPLPATFSDFWKLIWDENAPLIMMLTALRSETGQIKGDNYWRVGQYGEIKLVSALESRGPRNILLRTITLIRNGQTRTVTQIHYENWPDVACPSSCEDLLALIALKRELLHDLSHPVVVHCSAGCGRTGTFCTVDTVITHIALNNNLNEKEDLVNATVAEFRTQRLAMVQVQRQFIFCYDTVISWYYQKYVSLKSPLSAHINHIAA